MSGVLRNRAFRWIATVLFLDALLEWFGTVALMALVYNHSHSAAVTAGLLICKQIAPGALVPLLGPTLDRIGVGRGRSAAFALQATTLVAIGAVGYGVPLFALAVSTGVAGTLVRSLLRTGFSRTLDGEALRAGNAFTNIGVGVTGLFGPALAAFSVSAFGATQSLVIAGAAMGGCALLATRIPGGRPHVTVDDEAHEDHSGPRATPAVSLRWLFVLVGAMLLVGSMDEPTLLAYSEHSLQAGIGGYGAFLTAWGAGMIVGGFAFSRLLARPMLRIAGFSGIAMAAAWLGLGGAPTIAVACLFATLGGIGNGMCWIALVTAIQEAAPRGKEATVATRLESIVSAAPGLGIVLGGVVGDLLGPRAAFLIPGLIAVALLSAAALDARRVPAGARRAAKFSPSMSGGSV